jgi:hypothetical protein
LKILESQKESAMGPGENLGLRPQDLIDLDPSEAEKPTAGESLSPPPVLGDVEKSAAEATGEDADPLIKKPMFFSLKK